MCVYCNNEYSRLDNLNRHQKKCVKQRMEDNCKQLEDKDKQIELLTNDTNKKLEEITQVLRGKSKQIKH